MNAFELLKADHKKVAQLFDQLEKASGKAKLDLFEQIKSELELHTHIEETIFYPALEKPEETHDLTLEAYEEHKVVKSLLSDLAGAKSANDEWQAKAKVLREKVEHHVEEEENELFDKANGALSDEQIESLGERMDTAKARKRGRSASPPTVAKHAKSSKSSAGKSILSRIADFVGLGGGTGEKKGAKKASAKKSPAVRKGPKADAKTAPTKMTPAKKRLGKSSDTRASKSSSAGLKRASGLRSTVVAKKRSGAGTGKKAAKKRTR